MVVFSVHGMGANTKDLPNGVFLPEALFRYSFPECRAITGKEGDPLPAMYTECLSWSLEVWLKQARHESAAQNRPEKHAVGDFQSNRTLSGAG